MKPAWDHVAHRAFTIGIGIKGRLLRGLRWSYPMAAVLMTAFIGYQGYRLCHQPSLLLGVLTVIPPITDRDCPCALIPAGVTSFSSAPARRR